MHGEIEYLSMEVEQQKQKEKDGIEWRRGKVQELNRQGLVKET